MKPLKKLRIAVFSDSFFPTVDGVVTSIVTTATSLAEAGHSVLIFAPRPKPKIELKEPIFKKAKVVWIHSIPLSTYGQYLVSPPFSLSAQRAFKEFSPDIVHCHTPFSLGWMGLNLAKLFKVPLVATYHTLLPDFLVYLPIPNLKKSEFAKKITWKYSNFFYNQASLVTTPTKAMAEELKKHKCPAIPLSNPIQFSLFNQFAKTKRAAFKKEFRLVYFGRLSFEKNIEVLLESVQKLQAKKIPATIFLIGDGPARESLKEKSKELKIEKFVFFTGILRGEELAQKVASCHVVVTASTMETQGLTVLEGMAAGLPCVGCNFLGIPDAVKESKNGFLFPPFKPETAAQKLEKIYRSKPLYTRLSKEAVKTAKPYSSENICKKWEKTYWKLVKGKKQVKSLARFFRF